MSSDRACTAVAAMTAAYRELAAADLDSLSHRELLDLQTELEVLARTLPTQSHRILARLVAEASPAELGAKSMREVLTGRLRISQNEARRRLAEAADLGPRTTLTGEPLEPMLAATAAAQACGAIGSEHVKIIRKTLGNLPHWVDVVTRGQAEASLVRAAVGLGPDELRKAAERLLALIDQDGPMPDDTERARRRCLSIGKQGADGMSEIHGRLDPQGRATLEATLAKWGAPGMCNPDDEAPCTKGTPSQEQIDNDQRTVGQRNHDALVAIGRSVLSSGELGQHNGLPATIIVSTTLAELERGAGCAVTAGGSLLPMADVIRLASHAHHYLVVFDQHTRLPLYLGRSRRCASAAQRIVLLSRDHGCTFPGCPVPGYGTQVHHITGWKTNGRTDIDQEVLACGPHNRLAEQGWQVRIRRDGSVEWRPPPQLDTGQNRVNTYHHPDRILKEPDEHGPIPPDS
ncbi:HNH endonuclease signature motif containing protein [Mycolicibacterium sp. XJ1819]